jgi:putative PIN family toxin of toxin-antitoxin system
MPRVPSDGTAMRIVADTNTVLSGLLWQGPPRRLIDLARERSITLCTSLILLAELAEVIARDKFVLRVLAAKLSAAELVDDYRRLAQIIEPQVLSAAISRDPDDDHVLACAAAAQVDLIVTRDKDLLVLNPYQRIPIVASAEALRLIGSG